MIIAVTGVIGSGKSSVAKKMATLLDAELCDTDTLCKDLLQKGNRGWHLFVERWGALYLDSNDNIDRVKLREAVFSDENVRKGLEDILHPLVISEVTGAMLEVSKTHGFLVVEVPLLFEVGWEDHFDIIVTVFCSEDLSIMRVTERDGVDSDQVKKTLSTQLSIHEKAEKADYVIDNSGSWENTLIQVRKTAEQIKNITSTQS